MHLIATNLLTYCIHSQLTHPLSLECSHAFDLSTPFALLLSKQLKYYSSMKTISVTFFLLLTLSGCVSTSEKFQQDAQFIVEYLLYDFPMPPDAEINSDKSIIMGTGSSWSGRINLFAPDAPGKLMHYYTDTGKNMDWQLSSSTISDNIIMVFKKANRTATVEIHRSSFLETKILRNDGTNITISVHHPKEIGLEP